jgi:N-acetylglucosamine malate deacetylase 1
MKNFEELVDGHMRLSKDGLDIPLGNYPPVVWPPEKSGAPSMLICSPHPDDEVLIGPLALKMRREGSHIYSLAMTLGREHQHEQRIRELRGACNFIGFQLVLLKDGGGLTAVNCKTHDNRESTAWQEEVDLVASFLREKNPDVINVHHGDDGHHGHVGTHDMVCDAISRARWSGVVFFSEFWHEMTKPNIMLEVSRDDLVMLLKALSFHVGEIKRNPYHLIWPSELHKNKRRVEAVMGFGCKAPDFHFAMMYRKHLCTNGVLGPPSGKGRVVTHNMPVSSFL